MELNCKLSPLVFAELYRLLADEAYSDILAERLNQIELNHDWLDDASAAYREYWESAASPDVHQDGPPIALSADHAVLATWTLAALRATGPSTDFDQHLRTALEPALVGLRRQGPVPSSFAPSVICWTLGKVVGQFDLNFPVVLAHLPSDLDVALAYRGLVEHVAGMSAPPWCCASLRVQRMPSLVLPLMPM